MLCNQCNEEKEETKDFRKNRKTCKKCEALNSKKHREQNKEEICKRAKEKRIQNRLEKNIVSGVQEDSKLCKQCKTVKIKTEFSKGRAKCKICISEQDKQRYNKNKDVIIAKKIQYQRDNRNEILEKRKLYREKKRQEFLENSKVCTRCKKRILLTDFSYGRSYCKPCGREQCRSYKARNREKISDYNKKYKKVHKSDISEYNKKYNIENRATIQKRHTKYLANYKKTNVHYRLALKLRNRIRECMKISNIKKYAHTLEILGCPLEFLKDWFKFRFDNDMTFENHGTVWHIDHVIPCSLFDFTDDTEQERCFHWTNLQPMKASDNFKKGNRVTRDDIMNQQVKIAQFVTENSNKYLGKFTLLKYNRFDYL